MKREAAPQTPLPSSRGTKIRTQHQLNRGERLNQEQVSVIQYKNRANPAEERTRGPLCVTPNGSHTP